MYKKLFPVLIFVCSFLAACHRPSAPLVGADRDAHNCIASAGYTFSQVRQGCIRMWEEGTLFTDAQDPQSTFAAYVVFSKDFSQAEVFVPHQQAPVLLRHGHEWTLPSGPWRLVRKPAQIGQQETWQLFENDTLRYKSHPVLTQPLYPQDAPAD